MQFCLSEVEACIIEPTGMFSVYRRKDMPADEDVDVLKAVPGYNALVESDKQNGDANKEGGGDDEGTHEQNEVAK